MIAASIFSTPRNGMQPMQRVLIMEDNRDLCVIYTKAVEKAGYEVHQAVTLAQARVALDSYQFDLFICDMRMGTESGLDLLRERRDDLKSAGTVIVVVSAEEQYRSQVADLDVDFFLSKPVTLLSLTTLIQRLTSKKTIPNS